MNYLRKTRNIPLILGESGTGIIKWWIDSSFTVHSNIRGHTGGGLSTVRGLPVVTSTKNKLNNLISKEAGIVRVDDCMPSVCWTRYFLEAQDYNITEEIFYQENQSSVLLEMNGKTSCSNRTKHINILFFFVTDPINKKESTV